MKKYLFGFSIIVILSFFITFLFHDYLKFKKVIVIISSDLTSQSLAGETLEKSINEQVKKHKMQPLWMLDLKRLSSDILQKNNIQEVHIRRRFPDQLDIEVKLVPPALLLLGESGKLYPINISGDILNSLKEEEVIEAPILKGSVFFKSKSKRLEVLNWVRLIPSKGAFSHSEISEIVLTKKNDYKIYLKNSQTLVLLSEKPNSSKPYQVERVLKYLNSHQLKGRVIDSRLSKKVVVKLRNAP